MIFFKYIYLFYLYWIFQQPNKWYFNVVRKFFLNIILFSVFFRSAVSCFLFLSVRNRSAKKVLNSSSAVFINQYFFMMLISAIIKIFSFDKHSNNLFYSINNKFIAYIISTVPKFINNYYNLRNQILIMFSWILKLYVIFFLYFIFIKNKILIYNYCMKSTYT